MSHATKIWTVAVSAILLASCGQKEAAAPTSVPPAPIAQTAAPTPVPAQTSPIGSEGIATGTGNAQAVETKPVENPVNENPKNTDVPLMSSRFFTLKEGKITLTLFSRFDQKDEEYVLVQADPKTFRILSEELLSPISKDANHVFYGMKTVEWAHAPTFEMINAYYAKDAYRVYARNGEMADIFIPIPWADVSTFRMGKNFAIGDLTAEDKNHKYWGYNVSE